VSSFVTIRHEECLLWALCEWQYLIHIEFGLWQATPVIRKRRCADIGQSGSENVGQLYDKEKPMNDQSKCNKEVKLGADKHGL
jgi:hypothetical protein